jgi:hypothetical protein
MDGSGQVLHAVVEHDAGYDERLRRVTLAAAAVWSLAFAVLHVSAVQLLAPVAQLPAAVFEWPLPAGVIEQLPRIAVLGGLLLLDLLAFLGAVALSKRTLWVLLAPFPFYFVVLEYVVREGPRLLDFARVLP